MSGPEVPSGAPPPPQPAANPLPGWFDDPNGTPGLKRYWDGSRWTGHVHSESAPYRAPAPLTGGQAATGKPWWKRTWVLVLAGLFAVGIVGSALAPPEKSGNGDSGGASSDEEQVVSVGEPVTVEGTQYRVISAEKTFSLGESFAEEKADGIFVVVRIELTNLKDDTRTIASEAMKLVGGNDKTYDVSTDALLAVDDALLLEDVQPDLAKEGTLVYDVPVGATSGAKLRVEDLFSDVHAFIDLEL